MTPQIFEEFLDSTRLLRRLIYGGEGFFVEPKPKFDIFKRMNIKLETLQDARTLMRLGVAPLSWTQQRVNEVYFAFDKLGGSTVLEKVHDTMAYNPERPEDDHAEKYEWATFVYPDTFLDIRKAQVTIRDYEMDGFRRRLQIKDVGVITIFFRKNKPAD